MANLNWTTKTDDVDDVLAEDFNNLVSSIEIELNKKVDKVTGKGLSTNDYTNTEKAEVAKVKDKADINNVLTKDNTTEYTPSTDYNPATKKYVDEKDERIKYYGDPDIIPSPESYFTVNSTGETITGLSDTGKTQTELVIPYKINGVEITTLYSGIDSGYPQSILKGSTTITKITIPKSVTTLGRGAFSYCNALTSIEIPNSVTSIGAWAFYGCTGLTSVNIPDSVTTIEDSAFSDLSLTSVNIPNSVTSIGTQAFSGSSLTSVNIPNSVTSIGDRAFYGCTALKSITIPNSVTTIGNSAFMDCRNLTIYCEQGSYAETYANTNNIPVKYTDIYARSKVVKNENQDITLTCDVNTIYDLGGNIGATNLNITLPNKGQYGDFIQVDFYSDSSSPTNLTLNSNAGFTSYDLIPQKDCIYSLYFDWGMSYSNNSETYGWRFGYAEYPHKEV